MDKVYGLINDDICNNIIYNSELKNHIDINLIDKKTIDKYFENCISIMVSRKKLFDYFIEYSKTYTETKYHKENLITHLYCVGWICSLFAHKFNLEPEFAFELGFFHDIGKPWSKKQIPTKKKIISTHKAHAQIGEHICSELNLDEKISWCVSNHMCSCCHENNLHSHWEYVGSLQTISISDSNLINYANCLACLMIGDDLGRLGENPKNYQNIITHSNTWLNWFKNWVSILDYNSHSVKFLGTLHPDNSIIVQLYGHSGFGNLQQQKN